MNSCFMGRSSFTYLADWYSRDSNLQSYEPASFEVPSSALNGFREWIIIRNFQIGDILLKIEIYQSQFKLTTTNFHSPAARSRSLLVAYTSFPIDQKLVSIHPSSRRTPYSEYRRSFSHWLVLAQQPQLLVEVSSCRTRYGLLRLGWA